MSEKGPVGGPSVMPSPPIVLSVMVGWKVGNGLVVGSLVEEMVNEWPAMVREGSTPALRDSPEVSNTSNVELCLEEGRAELETMGSWITLAHLTAWLFRALLGQFIGKYRSIGRSSNIALGDSRRIWSWCHTSP